MVTRSWLSISYHPFPDEGSYRLGTVEMMNSPMVICAYLSGKNQMDINGVYEWNSKKWRAWAIVSALKRFKRQCARNGVLQEVRKREHYEKPSVKRKKKSEAARKRKF